MPFDAYSFCPGGTGKKTKFCCPDLVTVLQKIDQMLRGEQNLACLNYIEQVQQKTPDPDRACLLAVKTALLRVTGQPEQARQVAATFLQKHPDNPIALAESAILTALEEGGRAGMGTLQRAIAASADRMEMRVYEAMATVAEVLLGEGQWLAGRALLQLQVAVVDEDRRPVEMLIELHGSPVVPLLFKEDPPLATPPNDAPWKTRFEEALEATKSARWQAAAEKLAALADEVDGSPAIWRNLATLRGWLADGPGLVQALRKLATLDIPLEEAVEAEALAMLCCADPLGDQFEVIALLWTINDFEQLQAAFTLESRALQLPLDPSAPGSEGSPPPKAAYMLLDRPLSETAEPIALEGLSRFLGQAMIYGRQTDCEARLEVVGVASSDLEQVKTLLGEVTGDALDPDFQQEVMARASASHELLHHKWRPPGKVTPQQVEALAEQHTRDVLLNRWPQQKLGILDGRSPREVAGDESCRVRLLAAIMLLQLWSEDIPGRFDFNELRRRLGLPTLEPIDPQQTAVDGLPLVRLSRVMVEQASDETLLAGYRRALAFNVLPALRKFAPALADRPGFAGREEQLQACRLLVRLEEDLDRALRYLEQGRQSAGSLGQSCASWDLLELPLRLARAEPEEISRLINHVQGQHIREPGVAEALMQWLVRVGAIRPDGTPPGPAPREAPAAAGPGQLWTPDGQQPGGQKKIWTPD